MIFLYFVDISPIHIIKKLQPKENTNSTDTFQTVILGRHESHGVKDFYLREIRGSMLEFECQWRDDERNYKGMLVTHDEKFTDRKDQCGRSNAGNKPTENKHGVEQLENKPLALLLQKLIWRT